MESLFILTPLSVSLYWYLYNGSHGKSSSCEAQGEGRPSGHVGAHQFAIAFHARGRAAVPVLAGRSRMVDRRRNARRTWQARLCTEAPMNREVKWAVAVFFVVLALLALEVIARGR